MRKAVVQLGFQDAPTTPPEDGVRAERVASSVPTELLTPAELASRLKIAPISVKRMLRKNELPFVLVGKRPRFSFNEVWQALYAARSKKR